MLPSFWRVASIDVTHPLLCIEPGSTQKYACDCDSAFCLLCPQVLKESALVEAFNLKGAIEYNMKNYEAARDAMADAPPRTEEELDPVSAACQSSVCHPCIGLLAQSAASRPAFVHDCMQCYSQWVLAFV